MKRMIFCSYFGFERKKFLSDCFRFYIYIDMGGRIAGKQDMPSLIIEEPPRAHQIAKKNTFLSRWGGGNYVSYRSTNILGYEYLITMRYMYYKE